MKKLVWGLLAFLTFSATAFAETKTPMDILGTYDDWSAYVYQKDNGKVCYITTEPIKSVGKYKQRGDVFLYITHHPADSAFDVVDVVAGYTYKKGSKPTLTIDKNKPVVLYPVADMAWAKDAAADAKLVAQMKKGTTAVLQGTSMRGTWTTDTFSLKGFSKAYRDIQKACGRE